MKVHLPDLKSNPFRDFKIDPIDTDAVNALKQSIKEDGFWGGVVCRKARNGELQIAAGHHRVKAAIKAGITDAEIFVSRDMDDEGMVRVYARENSTQRGNTSTAVAGTVAGALRFLAEETFDTSKNIEVSRHKDKHGIGEPQITEFLHNVPGINAGVVRQQLAALKASGDYERILKGVEKDIKARTKGAIPTKAAERLTRAIEKAKPSETGERTFDIAVKSVIKTPSVSAVFQKHATSEMARRYLPVEMQVPFAKHLVEQYQDRTGKAAGDITASFVDQNFFGELNRAHVAQKKTSKEEQKALEKQDWNSKAEHFQQAFAINARGALNAALKLSEHDKKRPSGVSLHVTKEFRSAVNNLRAALEKLAQIGL